MVFWYTGFSKWMVLVFFRRQCLHTSTAPNTSRAMITASKDKREDRSLESGRRLVSEECANDWMHPFSGVKM